MATESNNPTLDSFPKPFVSAMRTLFDILDDNRTGLIELSEIERRWAPIPANKSNQVQLPVGVLEALRKRTPSSGLLSFENFCCGLKVALLQDSSSGTTKSVNNVRACNIDRECGPPSPNHESRLENGHNANNSDKYNKLAEKNCDKLFMSEKARDQSRESERREIDKKLGLVAEVNLRSDKNVKQERPLVKPLGTSAKSTQPPNMATVRPTTINSHPHHRMSMPVLGERRVPVYEKFPKYSSYFNLPPGKQPQAQEELYGRVTRANAADKLQNSMIDMTSEKAVLQQPIYGMNRRNIVDVLKSWQHEKMVESHSLEPALRGPGDGNSASLNAQAAEKGGTKSGKEDGDVTSKNKRNDSRRHTLANGIDYSMVKRMKQLEQEKVMLFQGLEAIEKARDWYHLQVVDVQERQKQLGATGAGDCLSESYQDRLNFQWARILEINQHLAALVQSTDKDFPQHMNLALRKTPPSKSASNSLSTPSPNNKAIACIKEQNSQLLKEVNDKGEKVVKLEREKAELLRQLFEARGRHRVGMNDSTFM
ncbi:PREDICTED: suppressor APC domain-containing protein 2-like [Priapulus caudatus]|uniref:Suppressor APC domain-containing protein 2-like n=1 Tax=Priapulus caudatus TaxID=37621 RepID=A0ABM1ET61_PRICU|nr:PREDICTED: suppressor APC domain-containing protein 2-like [Priapulus caudatus]